MYIEGRGRLKLTSGTGSFAYSSRMLITLLHPMAPNASPAKDMHHTGELTKKNSYTTHATRSLDIGN